jgi:hypothetical protein
LAETPFSLIFFKNGTENGEAVPKTSTSVQKATDFALGSTEKLRGSRKCDCPINLPAFALGSTEKLRGSRNMRLSDQPPAFASGSTEKLRGSRNMRLSDQPPGFASYSTGNDHTSYRHVKSPYPAKHARRPYQQ